MYNNWKARFKLRTASSPAGGTIPRSTPLTLASPQKNGYREEAYAGPGNRVLGRNSRVPVPTLWTKEDERALPVQSPWPHRLLPVGSGAAGGR